MTAAPIDWREYVGPEGLCGLCGNHGIVDTKGVTFSPVGVPCGVRRWCICPNGRALKVAYGNTLHPPSLR